MIKLAQILTVIVIMLSTFPKAAFAQSRTSTSATQATLHIQVMVVPVVMTDQNPKVTSQTAISYSIPTVHSPMSVTKAIQNMLSTDGKTLKMVEITTVVAE
jgi:hypothetical protein